MYKLSIIIPAYNEVERIEPTLRTFDAFLKARNESYEIIVVDDGSTDKTVELLRSLKEEILSLVIVESETNKGKGHAVRLGMLRSKGEIRIFSDADGSTPITELDKLLCPIFQNETDIAIGSRYIDRALVTTPQPRFRRIWSRFANKIVQRILLPGIGDPHCGFKAFRAEAANSIFWKCKVNEWSFDLEVLAFAENAHWRIKEIPVRWDNDDRSKGKVRHLPREIRNLYQIRKRIAAMG